MAEKFRKYDNAVYFRKALDDRIKNIARERAVPLDRLRRQVTFDRFLARLFDPNNLNPQWLLKGGYALEFRFHYLARTTKDIDFSIPHIKDSDENAIREMLQEKAKKDLSDWFQFFVGLPMREFDQAVYGGWRYPIEARVANRIFSKFHIDISIGDAVISKEEWKTGEDILDFAGIEPARVAVLPIEQHFAEKIHAYSYPREKRPFSRIRDLVDLIIMIEQGPPDSDLVQSAIEATFKRRSTHEIPKELEMPPAALEGTYVDMAQDCGVERKTMESAFALLKRYWSDFTRRPN
jgi:hypothetical protein